MAWFRPRTSCSDAEGAKLERSVRESAPRVSFSAAPMDVPAAAHPPPPRDVAAPWGSLEPCGALSMRLLFNQRGPFLLGCAPPLCACKRGRAPVAPIP